MYGYLLNFLAKKYVHAQLIELHCNLLTVFWCIPHRDIGFSLRDCLIHFPAVRLSPLEWKRQHRDVYMGLSLPEKPSYLPVEGLSFAGIFWTYHQPFCYMEPRRTGLPVWLSLTSTALYRQYRTTIQLSPCRNAFQTRRVVKGTTKSHDTVWWCGIPEWCGCSVRRAVLHWRQR